MSNLEPLVQIGEWYYQVLHGQLWPASDSMLAEEMIRLEPRLHSLLNHFLLHPGELLSKDTLIEKVWPANEGTDAAVMRAVGALRKVLGDDVRSPRYIETLSKKGYRWLAEIQPLTSLNIPAPAFDSVAPATSKQSIEAEAVPWRFIALTALTVLISCASLAYVLTRYSPAPFIKLPDTITPVSALAGQEYWPLQNDTATHVVYQHSAPSSDAVGWSRQDLTTHKAEFAPEQYQQLSAALWLDAERIFFRAITGKQQCYFYQQQVIPFFAAPQRLWPCQQMLVQGSTRWKDKLLWLDTTDRQQQYQLWMAMTDGEPELIYTFEGDWRKIEHMVSKNNRLFLLAQDSFSGSQLLALNLESKELSALKHFTSAYKQLAIWDDQHLLIKESQQLVLYNIDNGTVQGLGPLTADLSQATRYPAQVLAKQTLGYTTDILAVNDDGVDYPAARPWQVSNRSENMPEQYLQKVAFVSERAGHNQIWLTEDNSSRQLTQLLPDQRIQQLLWHQHTLMAVINGELFVVNMHGELLPHPVAGGIVGRYKSCFGQLYWTERTNTGWQLKTQRDRQQYTLIDDVVDVRCGPADSLVLQFARHDSLALYQQGVVSALPIQLNWRQLNPEQWFADDTGIFWLDHKNRALNVWYWGNTEITTQALSEPQWPVGIYSNGAGLGYVVRPRPIDTDVVWLQNRR